MKKHLLVFCLATLLMAALNYRNNTIPVVAADFPVSELTELAPADDTGKIETAIEANSLFMPPSTNGPAQGDTGQHNVRIRFSETILFKPAAAVRDIPAPVAETSYIIARNGAFHRASDYYVYTLRRIVI